MLFLVTLDMCPYLETFSANKYYVLILEDSNAL